MQELFLDSGVGLSDRLFEGCTNLKKVTYCGITPPKASSLFASDQVQVNVPSIYEGNDFGGRNVTKSTDVDSICNIQTPTPVETTSYDPTTTTETSDPTTSEPSSTVEESDPATSEPSSTVEESDPATSEPSSTVESDSTSTDQEIDSTTEFVSETATDEQGPTKAKSNTGLIIGVIFALLAIILVLLILIWLFLFKRRKEDTTQDPDHELTEETIDSLTHTESVYGTEMAETEENPLFARELDFDEYRNDFEEAH